MRVYNEENEPFDFCRKCSKVWRSNFEMAQFEDFDVDCDHPDYEDSGYECDSCGQKLTDKD